MRNLSPVEPPPSTKPSFGSHTVEAEKYNLPKPSSWKDLLKPVYQGYLVMPNPNSSGTGFLTVSAWMQMFGEEQAWDFMDKIHQNMAVYTHSGSKPCRLAAAGEHPIGISFAFRGARPKAEGCAPRSSYTRGRGRLGGRGERNSCKTSKHKIEAAKKLMDWSHLAGRDEGLQRVSADSRAIPEIWRIRWSISRRIPIEKMIENDFGWAANNRKRILKRVAEALRREVRAEELG